LRYQPSFRIKSLREFFLKSQELYIHSHIEFNMSADRHVDVGLLELQVLWLLNKRPLHGYLLMRELSQIKQAAITQGTLYPLLAKLAKRQWIKPSAEGPRRKKTYQLTSEGARVMDTACREFVQIYSSMIFDYCCSSCKGVKHAVTRPYKTIESTTVVERPIALLR